MEKIKKTILQAVGTQGVTCPSGTTGPCEIIVPDLLAVYYIKINLTAELMDVGFLDAYVEPVIPEPPVPPEPPAETFFLVDSEGTVFYDPYNNNEFIYE